MERFTFIPLMFVFLLIAMVSAGKKVKETHKQNHISKSVVETTTAAVVKNKL